MGTNADFRVLARAFTDEDCKWEPSDRIDAKAKLATATAAAAELPRGLRGMLLDELPLLESFCY